MKFTKMHGIGNDYIYINCFAEHVDEPENLAVVMSDRHYGIGSDGLILALPSDVADVRMRMFNADGSEAEMCGNGIRCLAKFVWERKLVTSRQIGQTLCRKLLTPDNNQQVTVEEITVETGAGVLTLGLYIEKSQVTRVCVDMGEPILLPSDIPVNVVGQQAVGIPITVAGENYLMACVSMGNPHAVIFVNDVKAVKLEKTGPLLENHQLFPRKTNVHFVQVLGPHEVIMRTWERGSGITLACGTGAAAVCAAGVLASKSDRDIIAHLPGGDLRLLWNETDNHIYLVGPAVEVFQGQWPSSGISNG